MPEVLRKLGRYEIVREVGRGGMAVVYRARQTDLDRVVALKELGAFHAADPAFAERFVRESRIAGSLGHPNIVTVHDFFEHEGTPYIAMEYVEGGSLRPLVGHLTLAQIAGVLECVLAGLAHAEDRGIVHRDLKPENVMVTADGAVKIADFGIAKALNQAATANLSATGTAMGTPAYMAPEQALAKGIGPWTDLYSTGVIAYELLAGRLPFDDRDTPMAVLIRHIQDPVPPPRSVNPDLDERLAAWLERMLEKDPQRRPPGAAEAWDDLEEIVISLLGPRWRREARLVERSTANGAARRPTTLAPVDEPSARDIATKADGGGLTVPARREATPEHRPAETRPAEPPSAAPRRRRTLVLGTLGAAATATAGVVAAVLLVGSGSPDARTTESLAQTTSTQPPTTEPVTTEPVTTEPAALPRPIVEEVAIAARGELVVASVRLSGPKIQRDALAVRDRAIADGAASFVLRHPRVASRIGRRSAHGLTLQVASKASGLLFSLSSARGAFSQMSAPKLVGPRTVEVALRLPPPPPAEPTPPATTTSTSPGTTTTTTPATTTPDIG